MAGDGLGIIEGLPLPCDSPLRLVSGNFIDETMSNHQFCHVPIVLVEMHKERLSVEKLPEGLALPCSLFEKYESIAPPGTVFSQYLTFFISD